LTIRSISRSYMFALRKSSRFSYSLQERWRATFEPVCHASNIHNVSERFCLLADPLSTNWRRIQTIWMRMG
jgi:hypothetical protein